jgi:hypothetical protein
VSTLTRQYRTYDPELYDSDLEWLHQGYARELGEQGSLSSVVSSLEHGGYCSPSADVVEAMLSRLKWSCSAVRRAKRILPRWRRLSVHHRDLLTARYSTAGELPPRAGALLGDLATVVLWQVSGTRKALACLLRALERGDSGYCRAPIKAAERAARAAHKAWAATADEEVTRGEHCGATCPHLVQDQARPYCLRFDAKLTTDGDGIRRVSDCLRAKGQAA